MLIFLILCFINVLGIEKPAASVSSLEGAQEADYVGS